MHIPNSLCCNPPQEYLASNNPTLVRNYLCDNCRAQFDKQVHNVTDNNSFSEGNAFMSELVLNSPCWSDSGQPVQNVESDPMHLVLHYSRDSGGATITKIVADGTDHSFDPKGLPPLRIGGSRYSADAQYGTPPRMRPMVAEEEMDAESMRRIGLTGRNEDAMPDQDGFAPNQDDHPRLVFRKDANGKTISEIV